MVTRYSKSGDPYRIPPYSRAEREELDRLLRGGTLIRYVRHRRPAQPPGDQVPPAPRQGDTRPDRKQP
jgi:hypothetical protein